VSLRVRRGQQQGCFSWRCSSALLAVPMAVDELPFADVPQLVPHPLLIWGKQASAIPSCRVGTSQLIELQGPHSVTGQAGNGESEGEMAPGRRADLSLDEHCPARCWSLSLFSRRLASCGQPCW
jgi:hypothetical protein